MSRFNALKRRTAFAVVVMLGASLLVTTTAAAAPEVATEPSVKPAEVEPTAVRAVGQGNRDTKKDDAANSARRGNQTGEPDSKPGEGGYGATPLEQSGKWEVSGQGGDFSWSYPLRVPPSPGGQPSLALSYSSGAVDGLTSASNNQASWVGDGWNLWSGAVERVYGGCQTDLPGRPEDNPGDLCWKSDNAVLSLNGMNTMLIRDDQTGVWRPKHDNGSRVERIFNNQHKNGARDGEHWRITTTDGTQYWFGVRTDSAATWTVPVVGDDAGEPCHRPNDYPGSACEQGYRWNLDKVVNRNGDVMLYNYGTESNHYGFNKNTSARSYVRGGWLKSIEYGLRDDRTLQGAGRVIFEVAERCVPGSDCDPAKHPANFPDVPLKLKCDGGTCKDTWSPSFWTTKRLDTIRTEVRGERWRAVDSWKLRHEFPYPNDDGKGKPALWLAGITHTGHDGGEIKQPEVRFEGLRKANRVVEQGDGHSALIRFRIGAIVSETGAVTSVRYADPDCVPGQSMPDKNRPDLNTLRCFPAKWAAPYSKERTDFFHKYVVASVTTTDWIGSELTTQTDYAYLGGAAWHYDETEFVEDKDKTWNSFRGFKQVEVRTGNVSDAPKSRTKSTQTFHRGMHGDKLKDGTTRVVHVTDSEGGSVPDENWLQGQAREAITYLGDTTAVVSKTITDSYVRAEPTAKRGVYHARLVRPGGTRAFTTLAAGGQQEIRARNLYDEADPTGMVVEAHDYGVPGDATDDRCTKTTYVRDTAKWLMELPSRVERFVVPECKMLIPVAKYVLGDTLTTYDGSGNALTVQELKERPASGPVYVTVSTARRLDAHGRALEVADTLGHVTKSEFTPALGGPVTGTKVTNAKGFVTTATMNIGNGQVVKSVDPNGRVTEAAFDALGRTTEVWRPGRDRATSDGNVKYGYVTSQTAPNVVTTATLGPRGTYVESKVIYDGQLRPRQTQTPTDGGRLLTDTRYDSHGRVLEQSMPFFNDKPIDDMLWKAANDDAPRPRTVTEYDGAGRAVAEVFTSPGSSWRTTTKYGGDRVEVTPPPGGTPTVTISDARGQVVERRTLAPDGSFDSTTYSYRPNGEIGEVRGPAGNVGKREYWKREYDLRGRLIVAEDPDKGRQVMEYDDAGQMVKSTDANGDVLTFGYDELGRKKTVKQLKDGKEIPLTEWKYDTAKFGLGLPETTTRWVGAAAYPKTVSYDSAGRPAGITQTIPPTQAGHSASYLTTFKYNPDGSVKSTGLPAIGRAGAPGSLAAETVTHHYDEFGRMKETEGGDQNGPAKYVSDTTYTKLGEPELLTMGTAGGRTWITSVYDPDTRRPKRTVVDTETTKPIQADVRYTQDPAGNLTSIADDVAGQSADHQCFRYDHLRRLSKAWTPATATGCATNPAADKLAGPAPYYQSFSYDKSGNRLSDTQHAATGETTRTYGYTGHKLNRAALAKPGAAVAIDEPGYDKVGNTIARKTASGAEQKLDWDAEGKLTKVTEGNKVTSFVYGAGGERIVRDDPSSVTITLSGQEVRVDKATGALTGTRYYGHGQVVAVRTGGQLTRLATDHQGTMNVAVDATTLKADRRRQLPFGGPRGPQVDLPGDKGFVGGTEDTSAGFVTLGVRQYDPDTGRFLSVDPVLDLANSQLLHAYTYSANNPVTFSDPTGAYCDSCNFYSWTEGTSSAFNPDNHVRTPSPAAKKQKKSSSDYWKEYNSTVPPLAPGVLENLRIQVPELVDELNMHCTGDEWAVPFGPCAQVMTKANKIAKDRQEAERERKEDEAFDASMRKFGERLGEAGKLANCLINPALVLVCFRPRDTTMALCGGGISGRYGTAGLEGCVAVDDKGLGVIGTVKGGLANVPAVSASIGPKWIRGDIEKQDNNTGYFVNGGVGPGEIEVGWDGEGVSALSFAVGVGTPVRGYIGTEHSRSKRLISTNAFTCRYCQNIAEWLGN
ncbi:RHS repeat domain-containing protein [Crossiella sp. CA198]|uniref:RHS repeat domain-containing protein n=1 Tax=Crossiella sp. CA198 TaxID=3455607 RepID=UPI003F8D3C4E